MMFETCDYDIVDGDIVGTWTGYVSDESERDHVRLKWSWALGHNLAMVALVAARDAADLKAVRDYGGILLAMSRIAPMEEKLSTLHFMASHLLGYAEATTADIRRAISWARQFEAWAERGGVEPPPDDTSDWTAPVRHVPVLHAANEDAEWRFETEDSRPLAEVAGHAPEHVVDEIYGHLVTPRVKKP